MSTSKIASMALARIGQPKQIAALDTETSPAAIACRLFYDQCRDAVLADFPWPFAERTRALALVSSDYSDEWQYAYREPDDCVRFRRIVDPAGRTPNRIPYAKQGDSAGVLIVTDQPQAVCVYTVRIVDTARFPVLFADALAWRLAREIAGPLSADAKFVQQAEQGYEVALSAARARASSEQQPDAAPDAEWIRARA